MSIQQKLKGRIVLHLKTSLKLLANSLAISTGLLLHPIVFTQAVPTITSFAILPTSLDYSGVPIPNPTHGTS